MKKGLNLLSNSSIAIIILFLAIFVLIPGLILAADTNWSIDPNSTATGSGGGSGIAGYWSIDGVPNNVRDNNTGTYYGGICVANGLDNKFCNFNYSATVTFPKSANINRVEIIHSGNRRILADPISWSVNLNINNTWQTAMSGGNLNDNNVVTSSQTGSWSNVSAIRITASGLARAGHPEFGTGAYHRTHELRAWSSAPPVSPPTIDIKANASDGPITITYNTAANLSWISTDATSCNATGSWTGAKATTSSESTGNLTSAQTYTLSCSGPGGSPNSDSVTVNVESPPIHNVTGWAWSETIGWISLSCTNTGSCAGSDYGLTVDDKGRLSGYVWSDNIGWISFGKKEIAGCPTGSCESSLDTKTGVVSGWARACAGTVNGDCTGDSRVDGWDGWIHLNGTTTNGASYGVSVAGPNWSGYAWGSVVVGWISFRGIGSGNAYVNTFAINSCSPNPTTVKAGQRVVWTASLSGTDGTETYSWKGDAPLQGLTGNPIATTYITAGTKNGTVTVTKQNPPSKSKDCSPVVVVNPGIISFTASQPSAAPGILIDLSWTTSGFGNNDCGINPGIGGVRSNDTVTVSPVANTTYILACDDRIGNLDSRQTSINILGEPKFKEIKPP